MTLIVTVLCQICPVVVQPTPHQTTWTDFLPLSLLIIGVVVFLLLRWKVKRSQGRAPNQHAVVTPDMALGGSTAKSLLEKERPQQATPPASRSKPFGMFLLLAFLLSFFVNMFLSQEILNIYAWGLIIGLVVFFVLRSQDKKAQAQFKNEHGETVARNPAPEHDDAPVHERKHSSNAIVSLVLGILGLTCIGPLGAIPAIICGHIAKSRINKSNGILAGSGMALTGLILGYLGLAIFIIATVLPPINSALARKKEDVSLQRIERIAKACLRYADDNDSILPEDVSTLVDVGYISSGNLQSPFAPKEEKVSYELVSSGSIEPSSEKETTSILLQDKHSSRRGKQAVAYLDGRTELIDVETDHAEQPPARDR